MSISEVFPFEFRMYIVQWTIYICVRLWVFLFNALEADNENHNQQASIQKKDFPFQKIKMKMCDTLHC